MKNLLAVLVLAVVFLVACAPQAAPAPQSPAPQAQVQAPMPAAAAAAPAAPAKLTWEIEWDRTLEAAKKEGVVTLGTSAGALTRAAVAEAFRSRFGIRSEWIAGAAGEVIARIKAERRARIYSMDLAIIGGKTPVSDLKPAGIVVKIDNMLFLPDLTDPREIQKVWRDGVLPWTDKDHTALDFAGGVSASVVVNTQLVQPGEIKSFRDLLAPKWTGKIVMLDPTLGVGPGATLTKALGDYIMGWDFVQQLAEQKLAITPDGRLQVNWVAQGKYAIALGVRPEAIGEFLDLGAPVKILLMEEGGYISGGAGGFAVLKDAPHPNAAKFFINWLLSKDGQTVFCSALNLPSSRLDVSVEGVRPEMIPDPKKKYVQTTNEEWALGVPEAQKKAKEIFAKLKGQ